MSRIASSGVVRQREEWRPIPSAGGFYEVSSLGRVRSVDRQIEQASKWGRPCIRRLRGCILRPCREPSGYLGVHLGRSRKERVHELVAEAFIGPRPPGHHTRHGKLGVSINWPANLSYGTAAQNHQDRIEGGGSRAGERHPLAKLSAEQVSVIRAFCRVTRGSDLAALFGVREGSVFAIWQRSWDGVQPMEPRKAADYLRSLILRTGSPYPRVYVDYRNLRKDAKPPQAPLPGRDAVVALRTICRDPSWLP